MAAFKTPASVMLENLDVIETQLRKEIQETPLFERDKLVKLHVELVHCRIMKATIEASRKTNQATHSRP